MLTPLFSCTSSFRTSRVVASMSLAVFAMACSGDRSSLTNPLAAKSMSLSFSTGPVIAASGQLNGLSPSGDVMSVTGAGLRASGALQVVSGKDTLVISKVKLVLSHVELAQTTGASCDDDSSAAGCSEIEKRFVLVDLPTDTAVHTALTTNIPPGTYASLEARLRVPRTSDNPDAAAFLAAHPELAGANVRVEGTFKGQPFVYLGAVDTRFELAFSPPIIVDASGANVTVHVDVTTWFRDSAGALIDPVSANAGGTNAALVATNIRRSLRAVRDDERDGKDHAGEHGEHGSNGHG